MVVSRDKLVLAALLALTHTGALVAGVVYGTRTRVARDLGTASRVQLSEEIARTKFLVGPRDDARETLQRHLDLLNQTQPSSTLRESDLTSLKILTLLRLSKVESGIPADQEMSHEHRAQARKLCTDAMWRDCSDEAMDRLLAAR